MPQHVSTDRMPFWGGVALCVLGGALHVVDLALFVDAASGFAARGPALGRCAAAAVAAVLLWWLGRGAVSRPERQPRSMTVLSVLLRLAGTALAALAVEHFISAWQRAAGFLSGAAARPDLAMIVLALAQPGVAGMLAGGVLALMTAVWLLWPGPRALFAGRPVPRAGVGTLLLLWPFWLALQRFLVDPASVDRLPATWRVLSAAALLLFAAALLRVVYLPVLPNGQGLFRTGMLCFLFCTCLELPQTLFELAHGAGEIGNLITAVAVGLLGLCGLAAAWMATGTGARNEP